MNQEQREQAARERLNRVPLDRRQAELEPVPTWFLIVLFVITGVAIVNWYVTGDALLFVSWLLFVLWFGGDGVLK